MGECKECRQHRKTLWASFLERETCEETRNFVSHRHRRLRAFTHLVSWERYSKELLPPEYVE